MKQFIYVVLLLLVCLALWFFGTKKQISDTITELENTEAVQTGTTMTEAETISERPSPILNQ